MATNSIVITEQLHDSRGLPSLSRFNEYNFWTCPLSQDYSVSPNPPPAVFWIFFPNGWEFLINFLHTYYTIISTLEY